MRKFVKLHLFFFFVFILLCIAMITVIYAYDYENSQYIKVFEEHIIDKQWRYNSTRFNSCVDIEYQRYVKRFNQSETINTDLTRIMSSINENKLSVLNFPCYGHKYVSSSLYPEVPDIAEKYFKHRDILSNISHLMSYHGCPIYDVQGRLFVQMPIELFILEQMKYCNVVKSLFFEDNITRNADSTPSKLIDLDYWYFCLIIFIIFVAIFIGLLMYYFKKFSWEKGTFLCVILIYVYVLFFLFIYSIYIKNFSDAISLSSPFIPDQLFDQAHLNSLIPRHKFGMQDTINYICNSENQIKILKYPINGHRYIVIDGYPTNLNFTSSVGFRELVPIKGLVTINGFPVYEQDGRFYVQVPLDVICSMDSKILEIQNATELKLSRGSFFMWLLKKLFSIKI